jgi:hypothetical protein
MGKLGKPKDTMALKESVVWIYPNCKVVFEKGKVVDTSDWYN